MTSLRNKVWLVNYIQIALVVTGDGKTYFSLVTACSSKLEMANDLWVAPTLLEGSLE